MVLKMLAQLIAGDSDKIALKKANAKLPLIYEWYDKYLVELKSEEDFKKKTEEFRDRVQNKGESVDDLLPEAFALVKAAAKHLCGSSWEVRGNQVEWNMVHYDVQLLGGIVMHEGKIAEMKTGEGKTLVCTLPIYLNALTGKGVFLVTVNDYLAQRDSEWMSGLYSFLGMTTGVILNSQDFDTKKKMYECDIVYGTNNEFGFDYLRDNMAKSKEQVVQRNLSYAIVDEVDSILVDEARTPLIISAPAEESTKKYMQYAELVKSLKENEHYNIDEKQKVATLSEEGIRFMENLLGLDNIYTEAGYSEIHHIEQALKAKALFKRDVDYMIKDGEIIIVDEFTGRLMPGRRYSDGLHQAIEAKERVEIQRESKTLASITFQNYFRLFDKLAGMTGTAKTEEEEFYKIYGLPVVVIPTNKPIQRQDLSDLIFKSYKGKLLAIAKTVKEISSTGQPVLIGTVSVEQSEALSKVLKLQGVKHSVLNAKQHEREAEIVAGAGQKGAVTIATNMAGRGTDIKLGEGVEPLGGLYVIGTERHESRRIDNQLRGRSGRQGDKGVSQFYISMDDDLMRIFGGDRVKKAMEALRMPEDEPITNSFITSSIESAQKRVEGRNFDIRKHIVEYDDVMNYHREIVYRRRKKILNEENIKNEILLLMEKEAESIVLNHKTVEKSYDYDEIYEIVNTITPVLEEFKDSLKALATDDEMINLIKHFLWDEYEKIESHFNDKGLLRQLEREVYLSTIDTLWMEHIDDMTYLRQNVALHAYGQKDPLLEYKDRAFHMFNSLLGRVQSGVVNTMYKINIKKVIQLRK
jgi:preprotein translocase subunit SecA